LPVTLGQNAKPRNASAARPTSPIAKDRDCMQVINKHCDPATARPQSTQVHWPFARILAFRTILQHAAGCHSNFGLDESAGSLFLSLLSCVLLLLGSFNSSFAHPPAPARPRPPARRPPARLPTHPPAPACVEPLTR
jgi:hypothetical protein